MNVTELGQWYYLIYVVPGGASLLTLALAFMGADQSNGGDGGPDGDSGHSDGGPDAQHGDGGPDGDANTDRGAGFKGHQHSAHTTSNHHGPSLLRFFGFGSIPAPFAWGSLLLGWSIFGFWATQLLREHSGEPATFVLPAMGAAVVGALVMARGAAMGIGRMMPADKSTAITTVDLVGLTGEVAYPVDAERGRVIVYDQYGVMHDSQARVLSGQAVVERGKKAMIVDYDPKRDVLIVEESV